MLFKSPTIKVKYRHFCADDASRVVFSIENVDVGKQ